MAVFGLAGHICMPAHTEGADTSASPDKGIQQHRQTRKLVISFTTMTEQSYMADTAMSIIQDAPASTSSNTNPWRVARRRAPPHPARTFQAHGDSLRSVGRLAQNPGRTGTPCSGWRLRTAPLDSRATPSAPPTPEILRRHAVLAHHHCGQVVINNGYNRSIVGGHAQATGAILSGDHARRLLPGKPPLAAVGLEPGIGDFGILSPRGPTRCRARSAWPPVCP